METNREENIELQDNIFEFKYKTWKAKLLELQQKKSGKMLKLISAVIALVSVLVSLIYFCDWFYEISLSNVIASLSIGLLVTAFFNLFLQLHIEMKEYDLQRKILEYEAEHIKENVEEDIFENSIKMSYKYLDQYYLQTREQAQKGFLVTVCVAVFGALLIGVGIVAMFLEFIQPSIITCAAGVLTEFIAAVFFYLYNRTISSMSMYHNKLVLSHNISIALKIADSLPEQDNIKTKSLIVTELLKDINSYLVEKETNNHSK